MFKLFKSSTNSKNVSLLSPVDGKMIALSDVPDKVFASKMMGDGVAFELDGNEVCAPVDGTITMIFPTLHAFGMKCDNGAEILIHIGLDTVSLNGEGFTKLADQGEKVSVGTPIVRINKDLLLQKGICLTTPMVVTNHAEYDLEVLDSKDVLAGKTEVMKIIKK